MRSLTLVIFALASPALFGGTPLSALTAPGDTPLVLKKGDRIAIVGNTLGERMQHDGWWETLIQANHPDLDLTIRNLAFSGDEIGLRLRSENFGSPDDWLKKVKANVIFVYFGYNESFQGEKGLGAFKSELSAYLKHLGSTKFDGETAPRIVLFSPIAHEDLKTPNLPDGKANNVRLALYTRAMGEVARDHQVPFIDLFGPSAKASEAERLTYNGIHLTEKGNLALARIMEKEVFGASAPESNLERIRTAVLDKNFHWFNRYRTVDGYSVFGGRAGLVFQPDNQTNLVVMQREMEVLDEMTALRDRKIWAIAKGKDEQVDDGNTSPFLDVKTNKPGPLAGGKHRFLSGEESIALMKLGKNLKANLFASEETWPELANPVQMSWDTKGRLWVAVWPTYPHWQPKEKMNDKLLILEDTNGDGKADKMTVFADNLHCPTGFELFNGGVIVAQTPDLLFLKDSDGDGKADVRERILHGLDSADTHHAANSFVLDPAGGLYFQEGTFHHTQVETPYGPPERCANAGVFRYDPRRQKFEVYITYGFANPHGHVFDRWGQDIVVDGTGANPYHAALFSGHLDFPDKHNHPPQVYQQRTRPCPGMEYLSSRHFPDDFQGNLLVGNVIGFQGILRYKIEDNGGSFKGTELEPIISSTDPNFRPSDLKMGPDGAIYFIDWHNPIIGHMQHNLRDPSRDRTHGRIYRITHEGRELAKPVTIADQPIPALLDLLKDPIERVRYRARMELATRNGKDVLAAANAWQAELDTRDADYPHHLLELLWLRQSFNEIDPILLGTVLASSDFRARAGATRVLSYWADRFPRALELLRLLAADEHPRVRLEAVRAASFLKTPEALDIPFIAADKPADPYVDFVRGETLRALEPVWRGALADKKPIDLKNDGAVRFLLRGTSLEALLAGKKTPLVLREILNRPGVREETRREALRELATQAKQSQTNLLLELIKAEGKEEAVLLDLVRLLILQPREELTVLRPDIERIALESRQETLRQIGWVMLMNVDGSEGRAWDKAVQSAASLRDLVNATGMISDTALRSQLYPRIEPLIRGLPAHLDQANAKNLVGRFVRVELPGRQRTLTLAEVEVFSDERNIAPAGKARQSTTSHGGDASKAIDGNKSTSYGDGGQTHSAEGTNNPWWEVDLGGDYPIDRIAVFNRGDGNLGSRLNQFTLKVLDRQRRTVFEKKALAAPRTNSTIEVGGASPGRAIKADAMVALTTIRGQEENTFKLLAAELETPDSGPSVIRALLKLPATACPTALVKPLIGKLVAAVRAIPEKERTMPQALEAIELADNLIGTLTPADAAKARADLGEVAVRIIRLGTLPERMAYDKEALVVKAGKRIEFILENSDLMPHNLVITQPGAMEEIGMAAEGAAARPEFQARQFVPQSDKVLAASRLLQPRESQRLSFTAPTRPGVYPYVCTYPGHWRRMYGSLYVVADPDACNAGPEAYLAAQKIEIKDALLKDRRPRTEWKVEDLAQAVTQLSGRNFGNGKQMFKVSTCIACHKMEGEGNAFGPDLAQLDSKWSPVDILREIIIPSNKINEKFQSEIFELSNGKLITGIVLEEKDGQIKIVENPLASTAATILKKDQVESRKKSPTSLMPKGMLDKLSRDEVLDLVAYIVAKGDKKSPVFQGSNGHGHGH